MADTARELFSIRVKELMDERGLSYRDVGKRLNVAPSTIHRYVLNTDRKVPSEIIKGLADMFSVSPLYIMGLVDKQDVKTNEERLYMYKASFDRLTDAQLTKVIEYADYIFDKEIIKQN